MTNRKAWLATALVSSLVFLVQCNTGKPIDAQAPDGGAGGSAAGSYAGGAAGDQGTAGSYGGGVAGAAGFGSGVAGEQAAGSYGGGAAGFGSGVAGEQVAGSYGGGAAGAAGFGGGGNGAACPAPSPASNVFLAATTIPYPKTLLAISMAVGDLNGDGTADLIVGGRNAPPAFVPGSAGAGGNTGAGGDVAVSTTVFLANKTGFAPGAPYVGPASISFGLADVNGDKQVDLVSSDYGGLTIRLNQGGGALGAPTSYDVTGIAGTFTTADLDGDGKAELLFPTSGLVVLKSVGGSSFASKTYDTGFNPHVIAAGELDGLAGTDVVLAGPSGIHVLFNDGGTGNLLSPQTFDHPTETIALVDIDGDSKLDIVAASGHSGLSVFLNLGGGTFAVARRLPMNGRAVFGDVDGDGKADAVVVDDDCSTVALYLNDGHGAFAAPSTIGGFAPGGGVVVALGDVNGDKALDLLTLTGGFDGQTPTTDLSVRLHRAP